MIKNIKEKAIGSIGSVSGIASILGSWQVCHNVCLALIAVLGIIGISLTGMPLAFLTKIAVPIWAIAVILLMITYGFYVKRKCISKNLLIFNTGLITAGIPFKSLEGFSIYFWTLGGLLCITAIFLFVKNHWSIDQWHDAKASSQLDGPVVLEHAQKYTTIHNWIADFVHWSNRPVVYFRHIKGRIREKRHKTDYEAYILYGILFLVVLGLIFSFTGFFTGSEEKKVVPDTVKMPDTGFQSINSGSTSQGDVSIELTPHKVANRRLAVDINVNTHSVSLDQFDLKKSAVLEYNGKQISPVSAPGLTGHHNSGELIFEVDEEINNFVIKIKGIPKIEERIFEWRE